MPRGLASGATLTTSPPTSSQPPTGPAQDTGLLADAVEAPGSGKPAEEKAGKLELDADPTGQLAYMTNKAIAPARFGDRSR